MSNEIDYEVELSDDQKQEALELYARALLGNVDQDTFHHINLGRQVKTRRENNDPVVTNIIEYSRQHIASVFDKWIESTQLTNDEMIRLWLEARSWKMMINQLMTIENMGDALDKQLGFDDPDWEGNSNE